MNEEEELREGFDTRLPNAIRVKEAVEHLLATKGWEYLQAQLTDQVENRRANLLLPLESGDAVFEREYQKGEAVGLLLAIHFPKQMLDDANSVIQLYQSTEDDDDVAEDFI